ncbi:ECF transporter S component [Thermasporomyces composti]|jgi:energy-coupling factor transport system substrate-specific component|uniref:Energy-coupling factor transport system substrate-specific component n=1 Tax=Thermasporomyces composti TaxID=696763 RepID=A0A3D9V079_THECX|nr:ECF transporter S component [Thermasporomyces composti]REF34927.1 energy-coupling factor transport system substrate-specific component [Thermasporomyces composti]
MTSLRSAHARAVPLRVRPRSALALTLACLVGVAGYGWPFLADSTSSIGGHSTDAPYLFALLLPLVVAIVVAELSDGGMDAKAVAMLGVLAAVGAGLRAVSPGTGGFEPTLFLVALAGRVFGAGFGFALGATMIVASGLVTGGVGPWMPYQMLGLAWVGMGAGLLPGGTGKGERWLLAGYTAIASLAFGALLNLSFWPFTTSLPPTMAYTSAASAGTNLAHYAAFYVTTSLGWDAVRAVVNATLVVLAGRAILSTLRRAARRAAFDAEPVFRPPFHPTSTRQSRAASDPDQVDDGAVVRDTADTARRREKTDDNPAPC